MSGPTTASKVNARVRFPVEGMTCASCVNRIERYLRKVDGIESADVNLATETASVAYDPDRVTLQDLGRAVEAAGYDARLDKAQTSEPSGPRRVAIAFAAPRTLALDIEGMTCASCVNRIERYLRKLDGVDSATVNLATERATVVALPNLATEAIIKAVEAAGYDARLIVDGAEVASARSVTGAVTSEALEPHAAPREISGSETTSYRTDGHGVHIGSTRQEEDR